MESSQIIANVTHQLKKSNKNILISENWIYSLDTKSNKRQGWKIHISCNPYNLHKLIQKAVPILIKLNVDFKVIKSRESFKELNTDIKQLGKAMTIYPKSNAIAVNIILSSKPHLRDTVGPRIITDSKISDCDILQYRYGSFSRSYTNSYGKQASYIIDTHKKKIIDNEGLGYTAPTWLKDPFISAKLSSKNKKNSELNNYHIKKYLLKQNKIIYLGTLRNKNMEVIIKQARINFKNDYKEPFQHELLKNEFKILSKLNGLLGTPKPISLFEEDGIAYSIIEAITSTSLYNYIESSYYKCNILNDDECLYLITAVLKLFQKYRQKNLILGDINPNNIIIDDKSNLRFIDFEYSHFIGEKWYRANTEGFTPPSEFTDLDICRDLYCIFSTIAFITTGRKLYLNISNTVNLHDDFVDFISKSRPSISHKIEKIFFEIYEQINQCEDNEC